MKRHTGKLSRRDFLRLAGLAAAGLAVDACTSKPAVTSPGTVKLVYQDWRTEWFPEMANSALEQFHAAHPDIRVFYTPDPPDVEVSLLEDALAGRAPDVFAACCTFFPILAQQNCCLDLNSLVSGLDQDTIQDWDVAQYQALQRSDGQQYGLPKYHGALALYYNKDVFDEFKVDYPDESWDYNDYLAAMKALTHDRNGDGKTDLWGSMVDISWDRIQVYVNAWGGRLVDPQNPRRSLMAQPEALQAMEWLRARMWDDRVMATSLNVENMTTRQAFARGKLAMVEDGSWALKDILTEARFRIGMSPLPSGPVRRVTLTTTDGFGVYARTQYPRQSQELLRFLISKEYGRAMAKAHFLQPARFSLVDEWVTEIRKQFPAQTQDVNLAAFADGHLKGYSVTTEIFSNMGAARQLAYDAWDRIYNLGLGAVDEMKAVSRAIDDAQE